MNNIPDKYEFITKVDWKNHFNEEELRMIQIVGLENFLKILDEFKGIPFYFTDDRINIMKKEYVKKNPEGLTKKDLARKVNFSLMTVYRYNNTPDNEDPGLFDKE